MLSLGEYVPLIDSFYIPEPPSSAAYLLAIMGKPTANVAWIEVKSTPMLQSKSNAPYLNRNSSYLYRLARHFGSNWPECSRQSNRSLEVRLQVI